MKFEAEIGFYNTLKNGGMNLPLRVDNNNKKEVQKNIYKLADKPLNLTLVDTTTGEVHVIDCILKSRRKRAKFYKLVFYLEEEQAKKFEPNIYKFDEKELVINLLVDVDKQIEIMNQISGQQRKKIYAIIRDINNTTGQGTDSLKETLKKGLILDENYETGEMFSLSNCPKEVASEFIEYLIGFCFQNGVELKEHPKTYFDDIEKYVYICFKNNICCVCGELAEVAHYDAIQMGNNRNTLDDSEHKKYPLCRIHHTEEHKIGKKSFCKKYHVKPIVFNG